MRIQSDMHANYNQLSDLENVKGKKRERETKVEENSLHVVTRIPRPNG